jgi:hypothetical protein
VDTKAHLHHQSAFLFHSLLAQGRQLVCCWPLARILYILEKPYLVTAAQILDRMLAGVCGLIPKSHGVFYLAEQAVPASWTSLKGY